MRITDLRTRESNSRLCGWHKDTLSGGPKDGIRECAQRCATGSIYCTEHSRAAIRLIVREDGAPAA